MGALYVEVVSFVRSALAAHWIPSYGSSKREQQQQQQPRFKTMLVVTTDEVLEDRKDLIQGNSTIQLN